MNKKNKLIDLIEYQVRWYYRMPTLLAVLGLVLAIVSMLLDKIILLKVGIFIFIVALGAQWVLGFENIGWKWKKK